MASKAILPRRRRRALLFGTLGLGLLGLCLTRVQARWLSSYPHAPAACLALWLPGLCIAFVRPQAMCHCTLWRCPPPPPPPPPPLQGLLPLQCSGQGGASTQQHAPASVAQHAPASTSAPDKLLVVVIAAGDKPVYSVQRGLWRLIRERVRAAGVHIYLVGLEPNITQPVAADDGALLFPGVNSLIPGVLEATVRALEHVHQHRLPGSAAPFVLRSNVSTFWNFWRLLA